MARKAYTPGEQELYRNTYESAFQDALMEPMEYFSHDVTARNDVKLYKLVKRLGREAKATYWDLVELLHSTKGHVVNVGEGYGWIAHELWMDETDCEGFVQALADLSLIEGEPYSRGFVSMARVWENAEKYAKNKASMKASAAVTNMRRSAS